MLSAMDNVQTIHRFLVDRTPAPFCDDCLSAQAEILPRQFNN